MSVRTERVFQLPLGMIPGGDLAEEFRRTSAQLRRDGQAEIIVDALHETDQPLDLVADLVLHDEAVPIVLRELPHARQA
jgi:hypothetical protein